MDIQPLTDEAEQADADGIARWENAKEDEYEYKSVGQASTTGEREKDR